MSTPAPTAEELGERVRVRWSRLLGREITIEEAAEIRDTWCRYLRAAHAAMTSPQDSVAAGVQTRAEHDEEDGPRSVRAPQSFAGRERVARVPARAAARVPAISSRGGQH